MKVKESVRDELTIYVKVKPLLWMVIFSAFWFLLMVLLLGTRRGESKAKLSMNDLSALSEIKLNTNVKEASITNVRVLYVVFDRIDLSADSGSIARDYCNMVKKNGALVETVKVLKAEQLYPKGKNNSGFTLIEQCNCLLQ